MPSEPTCVTNQRLKHLEDMKQYPGVCGCFDCQAERVKARYEAGANTVNNMDTCRYCGQRLPIRSICPDDADRAKCIYLIGHREAMKNYPEDCGCYYCEAARAGSMKPGTGNTQHPTPSDGCCPQMSRKDYPMARGLLDYFPRALAYIAWVSKIGNDQHNPGEALHWAKEKSTDHADCIIRHLSQRGQMDGEVRHTGKVAWRGLALLETELEAAGWNIPDA